MGSILGGKPKSTTTQANTVVVPSWLDKQNKSIASRAQELSEKSYTPYTGQRVADFSQDTNNAFALNRANTGKYSNLLDSASNGTLQLMQRANGPSSSDIQSLMNPYLQNVLDTQRRKATEVAGDQEAQLKRQAALSGSFGGSRFAVQQQKQRQDLANQMNDIEYQGLSDAFTNALNQWNIGTNTLGQGINSALSTATQGQQYDTNDIANLLKTGALQEDKTQAGLDVNYADWDTQQAYPYEQVTWLSNILNPLTGAYAGTESTGKQSTKSGGGLGQAIGTAASVASLFGFSDERLKENIEVVGQLDNGLSVYKYNFKGSPKTEIGLMAQEVEKTNPEAVRETPEGIKMVNYDAATEEKYASGGVVSSPQLLEALRQKTTSAGSPNFSGLDYAKIDSSNPILEMLGKGGSMSGSNLKSIGDLFGGGSNMLSGYDSIVGSPSFNPLIGIGAKDGGQVKFADGGFVDNLFDSEEEYQRKKAEYEASQKVPQADEPIMDNPFSKWMEYNSSLWENMEKQSTPSPDDSHAQLLLRKTVAAPLDIKNWADQGLTGLSDDVKTNYNDFFVRPASEVDAERKASMKERENLTEGLKNKAKEFNADPNKITPLSRDEQNGMPQMLINPETGDPYGIGLDKGASKPYPNVIPPIQENSLDKDVPMRDSNEDILNLLKQYLTQPEKKQEQPQDKQGGVNMPLLMAGLAMMASKGDTATALAEGAGAFMMTKQNSKKALEEDAEKEEEKRQKKIKNLTDYLKIQAYMQQVQGKTAGITPYQQAMLALKSRGLDIQQQNADSKKSASNGIMSLFGDNQALTPQADNANLEMLLEAFAAQEAQGSTPQISLDELQ